MTVGAHVSPTQMLVLQVRGQCCPPWVKSAAGHLMEGPVDGCHRCHFVTFTER